MIKTYEKPLIEILRSQGRDEQDIVLAQKAYDFAHKAHDGQLRKSNDPYIIHPAEVACILAELNADIQTICAALMHDVLEDCEVTAKEMEKAFGTDILRIVEGVTKLGKFSFSSKAERQAENFRKLIVAIADDFRVVLVKMADRLHNMRTLDHMAPHKQAEIAKETLEIYAPLANRFGLGEMKWELEDLGLHYLHPDEFNGLKQVVADTREDRELLIRDIIAKLEVELKERSIKAEIVGRPKHLFGIWLKMKKQQKSFEELYDVLAIRVIIDSSEKEFCEIGKDPDTQKCYEVMGVVHHLFTPIPGRFKDYIAMPKFNNYQSLHTAVIGPKGKRVEIQIRTRRMHHIAEYGIAAHWKYKEGGTGKADSDGDKKIAWLRQLVDWRQELDDANEYMEEVKIDLFSDQVFVFSPGGDVIDLPTGSTPIDFAYRIHTHVGHSCVGARINDRIVPLNTVMKNGDIVEIITGKNTFPKMDWLNFAKTHSAKSRIRQWFKKHHREEHIAQGRQMLESELGKGNLDESFTNERIQEIGKKLNLKKMDDILAAVGYGDISVSFVVNKIRELDQQEKITEKGYMLPNFSAEPAKPKDVGSLGGLLHHLAKCCQPVPGEEIVGVVTRGSGIAVHRSDCTNLSKVDEDRRMSVDWSSERSSTYPACLSVEALDRVGVAGDILKKISDHKVNLRDLRIETKTDKKGAVITLILEVVDLKQLMQVSQAISQISDVIRVQRKDHRKKSPAKGTGGNTNEKGK